MSQNSPTSSFTGVHSIDDKPIGVDRFGVDTYATALADLMLESNETGANWVIGVYAPWGSGKSFFLRVLEEKLQLLQSANNVNKIKNVLTTLSMKPSCTVCKVFIALILSVVFGSLVIVWWLVLMGFQICRMVLYALLCCRRTTYWICPDEQELNENWMKYTKRMLLKHTPAIFVNFFEVVAKRNPEAWSPILLNLRRSIRRSWIGGIWRLFVHMLPQVDHKSLSNSDLPVRLHFIHFNSWEYSGTDNLWAGLVVQLFSAAETHFGQATSRTFRAIQMQHFSRLSQISLMVLLVTIGVGVAFSIGYFNSMTWATELYQFLLPIISIIVAAILFAYQSWPLLQGLNTSRSNSMIKEFGTRVQSAEFDSNQWNERMGLMQEVRTEIEIIAELMRKGEWTSTGDDISHQTKFVLMMDDLDRCPADKATEVLKAINLLFDIPDPPFIAVISVDPKFLIQAVRSSNRTSQIDSFASAYHWLNKIVQIPFCLPPCTETKRDRLFRSYLPRKDALVAALLLNDHEDIIDLFCQEILPFTRNWRVSLTQIRTNSEEETQFLLKHRQELQDQVDAFRQDGIDHLKNCGQNERLDLKMFSHKWKDKRLSDILKSVDELRGHNEKLAQRRCTTIEDFRELLQEWLDALDSGRKLFRTLTGSPQMEPKASASPLHNTTNVCGLSAFEIYLGQTYSPFLESNPRLLKRVMNLYNLSRRLFYTNEISSPTNLLLQSPRSYFLVFQLIIMNELWPFRTALILFVLQERRQYSQRSDNEMINLEQSLSDFYQFLVWPPIQSFLQGTSGHECIKDSSQTVNKLMDLLATDSSPETFARLLKLRVPSPTPDDINEMAIFGAQLSPSHKNEVALVSVCLMEILDVQPYILNQNPAIQQQMIEIVPFIFMGNRFYSEDASVLRREESKTEK